MDLNKQTNELFDTYAKSQEQLWNRWMAFAQQLKSGSSTNAGINSANSLELLNEQAQHAIDISKAWARLWADSLEHSNNVVAVMATWNHQFAERQAEVSKQFEALAQYVKGLDEQARLLDVNKTWIRMWIESLDQNNGIVTAMMAWNRQIIDRQTEARRQFLNTWLEVFQSLDPFREKDNASPQPQSLEVLQDAINKAMAIPFDPSIPTTKQDTVSDENEPTSSAHVVS